MTKKFLNIFKVYEDEIAILLWTVALLFIIRSAGTLLNNFAETAFLKRYGVEYLPVVNMINAVITFFLTGILTAFTGRMAATRLLSWVFIICGVSITVMRLAIPLGYEIIYPMLFMMKSQFEMLQALMFWNLANDLFNTRQSKRLFPLVTAGGVVGMILGSFLTPWVASVFRMDNLLYVYLALTLAGALLVNAMTSRFPTLVFTDQKTGKSKGRTPMIEEFKRVIPLLKESTLFKIVLVLTFMPNVVIPIINYQFNYAIDNQFASEASMIHFFGYFRGVLNIISLFILLFVGRIYGRWGISVALMFHPFNYAIALLGFLFRFDIFAAMYARMSTNIIRTTINVPSNAILMGLFPDSYRAMIRPFLRGTVVRVALFMGSGLILISTHYFHPRYLSLVALPFVIAWAAAPFVLKSAYTRILMDLMKSDMFELKHFDGRQLSQIFKGGKIQEALVSAFLKADGKNTVWYARLLKHFSIDNFDQLILEKLPSQDDAVKIPLVDMLSQGLEKDAMKKLMAQAHPEKHEISIVAFSHLIQCKNNCRIDALEEVSMDAYLKSSDSGVRGHALACLWPKEPKKCATILNSWLVSSLDDDQRAGAICAGFVGDDVVIPVLLNLLYAAPSPDLIANLLVSLSQLGTEDINDLLFPYLTNEDKKIRKAAITALDINSETAFRHGLQRVGDSDESIRELASTRIREADYQNNRIVVESLAIPDRRLRKGLFELLEHLDIKDGDVYAFARKGLESCYLYLAMGLNVASLPSTPVRELVKTHLFQKKELILENVIRVLVIHDETGRMKTAWKGISSSDKKHNANATELLGDLLDRRLFDTMRPLLESPTPAVAVMEGRPFATIPEFDTKGMDVYNRLVLSEDWVDVVMGLDLSLDDPGLLEPEEFWETHDAFTSHHIIKEIEMIKHKKTADIKGDKKTSGQEISLGEKIMLLREIDIFFDLKVAELAAIAAVTEEVSYPPAQQVFKQEDVGNTVFMVISGLVEVVRELSPEDRVVLDTISRGGAFGEMALLDDSPRSATIQTVETSRFLILHKQAFNETVMEYPRIALQI
ncbi:MAG: Npt1/Npt2 family nucleotide transporter, partial [Desulfobacterium sp.]